MQLSLLPQVLEPPPGGEVAARYWPAGTASLIGGDFYDVFQVDERRWAVTIGDVCGKGIEAAAVTGLARHTLRAAARHFDSAADVLHALHRAMSDHRPATFCTVCFVYVETGPSGAQQMTMALGGHPQALLRRADGTVEEVGELGTLLGIVEPQLFDVVVDVAPGDTMVLYTDGLTDAPRRSGGTDRRGRAVAPDRRCAAGRAVGRLDPSAQAQAPATRQQRRHRRPGPAIRRSRTAVTLAGHSSRRFPSHDRLTKGGRVGRNGSTDQVAACGSPADDCRHADGQAQCADDEGDDRETVRTVVVARRRRRDGRALVRRGRDDHDRRRRVLGLVARSVPFVDPRVLADLAALDHLEVQRAFARRVLRRPA